jgi:hypothetical protein
MSKPLSILATIILLIVPSLVADRCTAESPMVRPCTVDGGDGPSVPTGPESPSSERGRHRPVLGGHGKWMFVAQGFVISIAHRVVLDRVWEAG